MGTPSSVTRIAGYDTNYGPFVNCENLTQIIVLGKSEEPSGFEDGWNDTDISIIDTILHPKVEKYNINRRDKKKKDPKKLSDPAEQALTAACFFGKIKRLYSENRP